MNASANFAKRAATLKARKESELRAEFKSFGCPFDPLDLRADAWLAGFKAGLAFAQEALR